VLHRFAGGSGKNNRAPGDAEETAQVPHRFGEHSLDVEVAQKGRADPGQKRKTPGLGLCTHLRTMGCDDIGEDVNRPRERSVVVPQRVNGDPHPDVPVQEVRFERFPLSALHHPPEVTILPRRHGTVKQVVAGAADDIFFRKRQELSQGPVPPDEPLAGVENHDHVLNGVQDLFPVLRCDADPHPPPFENARILHRKLFRIS
jgi:hypothetical protein